MRYRNLLIVLIFIAPVTVSLTTAEYMAMASEMSDSMNGAFLILYTIISASYLAFFGFGWNSGYLIRALSGLVVIALLQGSCWNLWRTVKTQFDQREAWLSASGCKDPLAKEHLRSLSYIDIEKFCVSTVEDRYHDAQKRMLTFSLRDSLIFPQNIDLSYRVNPLLAFQPLISRPWMILPVFFSIALWFFCPSKEYCRRRGWVKD